MPLPVPLATNTINTALLAIGGLVLVLGIFSDWL